MHIVSSQSDLLVEELPLISSKTLRFNELLYDIGNPTIISNVSLPTNFIDAQRKLRQWLEQTEQALLNDKVRFGDLQTINAKKKIYKDLFDQTVEQEHIMEELNVIAREYYSKLSIDISRRLQEESFAFKRG
ncbi:unnamed protein product [Rotaria sp. Silwood2]|nr:unnamed protein product [Rotaria sp. Silwood2]